MTKAHAEPQGPQGKSNLEATSRRLILVSKSLCSAAIVAEKIKGKSCILSSEHMNSK
jgi:hypothetical protein